MKPAAYPLEAARTLRQNEVDVARADLARKTAAVTDAELRASEALRLLESHRSDSKAHQELERARDIAGRTAADMARARAYSARRRTEEAALVDAHAAAMAEVDQARDEADRARGALALARAAQEAVERHRAAWEEEQRKAAEARREAEIDDIVSSRHGRERGS